MLEVLKIQRISPHLFSESENLPCSSCICLGSDAVEKRKILQFYVQSRKALEAEGVVLEGEAYVRISRASLVDKLSRMHVDPDIVKKILKFEVSVSHRHRHY